MVFGSSKDKARRWPAGQRPAFVASSRIPPAPRSTRSTLIAPRLRPSAALCAAIVIMFADIVVANDTDAARRLASSSGGWVYSIRAGGGAIPYPNPDAVDPPTDEARGPSGPVGDATRR